MGASLRVGTILAATTLMACVTTGGMRRPDAWGKPEVLVEPSAFQGVHGLAVDRQGRLLAGSVVGNSMWEVDVQAGTAQVVIPAPEGESDDIAVGPRGELAWTSYTQGILRYRENDQAPIRTLASGLAGINSLAFDQANGKLYASQVFYGDAVWEIDVAGTVAPRLITKDVGGFNGFEVGPDGFLYGPLWFKKQVVKIDPASGALTVINGEFATPAAANLDGKGNLWAIDTETGELAKVELASGTKTVVAQLSTSLDNLAIAADGTIYVSNMADNSVHAVDPATGSVRPILRGKLAAPGDLALDGNTLYVADIFAFRGVDVRSGAVTDVQRAHARGTHLHYPAGIGVGGNTIALASWATGTVQLFDRATRTERFTIEGLKAPMDALPLEDGTVLVAELGTGSLLRVGGPRYETRTPFTVDLTGPTQMVRGKDGALYLVEAAGNLVRIEIDSGVRRVVADQLALPDGIAQTPWGSFIVAESAAHKLTEIDLDHGTRRTVAEGLPIGFDPKRPGVPPPFMPTGLAVADDGTVYVTCDQNQSIVRIRPR